MLCELAVLYSTNVGRARDGAEGYALLYDISLEEAARQLLEWRLKQRTVDAAMAALGPWDDVPAPRSMPMATVPYTTAASMLARRKNLDPHISWSNAAAIDTINVAIADTANCDRIFWHGFTSADSWCEIEGHVEELLKSTMAQPSYLGVHIDWLSRAGWHHHLYLSHDYNSLVAQMTVLIYPVRSGPLPVTSDLLWRFHACDQAGYVPHDAKWDAMTPVCFGPSQAISMVEKLAIDLAKQHRIPLRNIGSGGERIGTGYGAWLYLCHDAVESYDSNGLLRFRKITCVCKGC